MTVTQLEFANVIAHRGAATYAPENTLAALQKAKQLGAKWVEFDVMLTKYGEAIVFHDERLERTTNGEGLVAQTPYAVIASLDAGSWFDLAFRGERVPSLAEWLQCANQLGLQLNLEMKATGRREAYLLAEQVAAEVARYWQRGLKNILVSSANRHCLVAMRKVSAAIPLAYITSSWSKKLLNILETNQCVALVIDKKQVRPERIEVLRRHACDVLAYTVNDKKEAEYLLAMGVTAVFSDNPVLLA